MIKMYGLNVSNLKIRHDSELHSHCMQSVLRASLDCDAVLLCTCASLMF